MIFDGPIRWLRAEAGKWRRRFGALIESFHGPRRLQVVDGDSLPLKMPDRDLVVARDGDEDWCVGFLCPCGCGRTVELLLIPEAKPRWSLSVDLRGRPSLTPSVFLRTGCRSHFWVRGGRIVWA